MPMVICLAGSCCLCTRREQLGPLEPLQALVRGARGDLRRAARLVRQLAQLPYDHNVAVCAAVRVLVSTLKAAALLRQSQMLTCPLVIAFCIRNHRPACNTATSRHSVNTCCQMQVGAESMHHGEGAMWGAHRPSRPRLAVRGTGRGTGTLLPASVIALRCLRGV